MLQAIMTGPKNIEFRQVEKPEPEDNEVLIKVLKIGICGSDIHVYRGQHPYTGYPVVQGHEVAGIIAEKGIKADGLETGEMVTFMPQVTCGKCYCCMHGMYHICDDLKVMGFQTDGAAQEYFAIDADMVLKLPKCMTLEEGALIEPASVAVHAIRRGGNVLSKNILVLGAGPIGNLVAQAARGLGADKVMITDINDLRLKIAKECGIDFILNPLKQNLSESITENFGGSRVDMIFECVGSRDTISQAISLARKGSTIVVVGVFGEKPEIDVGLIQDRELSLIGTLMYQKSDFLSAIELTSAGKLDLKKIITHTFLIQDYKRAYEFLEEDKDKTLKVVISL